MWPRVSGAPGITGTKPPLVQRWLQGAPGPLRALRRGLLSFCTFLLCAGGRCRFSFCSSLNHAVVCVTQKHNRTQQLRHKPEHTTRRENTILSYGTGTQAPAARVGGDTVDVIIILFTVLPVTAPQARRAAAAEPLTSREFWMGCRCAWDGR